ncbi:putative hydrolase or acyltransferase of alpha/beta superfamily [Xenococcus sp. PCC 7305]|uniref:alpha/beta fold hydrolase n=1 Tax=Xenococcus sp. PCC 7305 TaxID=102125 RepID=UPI0002ACFA97|nr:alpha/beta hydrolase [Xenococcus sp. PCC 7305]ELS01600.1 putative hydrolase or acyltransferase of alpha/beta superfamily [Xenococcus sp. PCC 7305]
MFPEYIPVEANQLTENTSIALAKEIKISAIATDFSPEAIPTTYVKQGNGGTPILLLHGFDSSLLEFRRLFPQLAEQQETWAVDLLGFGFSDRVPNLPYSAAGIKAHLYYFWKTLIKKPVILVGASMGGAAAIDFTLEYPETVEKLVLLDSAGLAKQPMIGKFMFPPLDYWATEFLRNPKVRHNISKAAYYDKSFASQDAQVCASLHLKCRNWNQALIDFTKSGGYGSFTKKASNIAQETLILWGKQDKILGTKDAHKFAKLIPNNQLVWIDNAGHVPHLEKSQAVAQKILTIV